MRHHWQQLFWSRGISWLAGAAVKGLGVGRGLQGGTGRRRGAPDVCMCFYCSGCLLLLHVWFPLLNAKQSVTTRQAECPLSLTHTYIQTYVYTEMGARTRTTWQWGSPWRRARTTKTTSAIIISTLNWILSARAGVGCQCVRNELAQDTGHWR